MRPRTETRIPNHAPEIGVPAQRRNRGLDLGAALFATALLDMVPIQGGLFRMGSPPASDKEIEEYAAQWAEVLSGKPKEQEEQVKGWRQWEEPA